MGMEWKSVSYCMPRVSLPLTLSQRERESLRVPIHAHTMI